MPIIHDFTIERTEIATVHMLEEENRQQQAVTERLRAVLQGRFIGQVNQEAAENNHAPIFTQVESEVEQIADEDGGIAIDNEQEVPLGAELEPPEGNEPIVGEDEQVGAEPESPEAIAAENVFGHDMDDNHDDGLRQLRRLRRVRRVEAIPAIRRVRQIRRSQLSRELARHIRRYNRAV